LGLSRLNFRANLPFNEMRQVFVPLKREKRYPRPLLHYFQIAVTKPRKVMYMRAVVQRVKESKVEVKGEAVGAIGPGLLIFLGVGKGDAEKDCDYLANKIAHLRIFPDAGGLMNLSLMETGGAALVVSQFTLWGDCRKGRRPSFAKAARPELAKELYEHFIRLLKVKGICVATGQFQEMMDVYLVNDGPVTLILDSSKSL
jgi:D-tyrosyl-tRNA(Tyr) deacylase